MRVPPLDLARVHAGMENELKEAAARVISSGRYVSGDENAALERTLAEMHEGQHAVAVNSGTDALLLGLMAAGVGPEHEVITTPFTFFATVECILALGAKPVFVDIDPESFCLNPELLERVFTLKSRVVIPVHLYGHPCDMQRIVELAGQESGVMVFEDSAQAIGAKTGGGTVGTFGDMAALSFYPTKNVGALGDAGAFVTRYDNLVEAVRMLRNHGQSARYQHDTRGINSRMDELQAAFLNIKLKHVRKWNEGRRALAARYDELLADMPGVITPPVKPGCEHTYHQYTIRVPNRDEVQRRLNEAGIGAMVHYPTPLHLCKALSHLGHAEGSFPEAERAAREVLCLPIFPGLTADEQAQVVTALRKIMEKTL
ncbi:DegT/DnrJ/EryC1/StrS family aminotransferase [bacterium]|nr:DegT/DnrJ/EryC1/StrS family aminotransferase [bacterium]